MARSLQVAAQEPERAVFNMEDEKEKTESNEIEAIEEEEQALVPASLSIVCQPTRSEFLDHCVTCYPFRAWCRHCFGTRPRIWA